jgi:hypothetical protein
MKHRTIFNLLLIKELQLLNIITEFTFFRGADRCAASVPGDLQRLRTVSLFQKRFSRRYVRETCGAKLFRWLDGDTRITLRLTVRL